MSSSTMHIELGPTIIIAYIAVNIMELKVLLLDYF